MPQGLAEGWETAPPGLLPRAASVPKSGRLVGPSPWETERPEARGTTFQGRHRTTTAQSF